MIKKISAIVLAIVLCMSMFIVPVSAAETPAEGANTLVWELKWDKEYYKPGDKATLNVYLKGSPDAHFKTGAIIIGFSSTQINPNDADNVIAKVKENSAGPGIDQIGNFWKYPKTNTAWLTAANQVKKITDNNTAEENAFYDTWLKFTLAWNSSGTHEGCTDGTLGITGAEMDSINGPFITYTFTVSANAKEGTSLKATIPSGAVKEGSHALCKVMAEPGKTTTVKAGVVSIDSCVETVATIGTEPCAPEAHTWDDGVVTTDPTCGATGVKTFTCITCKSTKTEDVDATGAHTAGATVVENEKDATCTATGSYENVVYCTECNAEMSRDTVTVDALGHTPADAVKENEVHATCTDNGSYDLVVYCSVCNAEISRTNEVEEATGNHKYVVTSRVESTCTTAGSVTYTCGCGETYTEALDATGHTEVEIPAVDATCTTAGSTAGVECSVCDAVITAPSTIDPLGHTAGDAVVENEVAATCAATGSYESVVYCTVCNTEISRNTITVNALPHTEVEIPAVDATCTTAGSTAGVECSVCDAVITAPTTIPAAGHDYVESIQKVANCTNKGIKKFVCSVCEDTYREDIPALGHTEEVIPGTDPTCISNGYEPGSKCSVCNTTIVARKAIPALGHTKGEFVSSKAATYLADGYSIYVCSVCNVEFKTDIVPRLVIDSSFAIAITEPSITSIRAKDTIVLHATMPDGSEIAEGVTIKWTADNDKFDMNEINDGKDVEITAAKKGTSVIKATAYDANGREITSVTVEMYSNAGFFQRIGGFFRSLFGSTKYIEF